MPDGRRIGYNDFRNLRGDVYYWTLPRKFLEDKVSLKFRNLVLFKLKKIQLKHVWVDFKIKTKQQQKKNKIK